MKPLRALALSALIAVPGPNGHLPLALTAAVAAGLSALMPDTAEARSGGYSRPRGGFRTPSFGSPGRSYTAPSRSRTPSTSGGYGRTGSGGLGGFFGGGSSSSGDRAMSRERSGGALDAYRSRDRAPAPGLGLPPSRSGEAGRMPDVYDSPIRIPRKMPRGYGPGYNQGNRSIFGGGGIGNIALMWLLFQSLNRPGYADYFHHQQNSPDYRQWRAEAEQRAADDPELKATLESLDRQLAAKQGQPVDPNFMPPNPPQLPASANRRTPSTAAEEDEAGGFGSILTVVLIIAMAGGFIFMWTRRKNRSVARPSTPWETATEIVRGKVSGDKYKARLFRVGMTIPVDPTPFILASGTKVPTPDFGSDNLVSVMAVGELDGPGQGDLIRLYIDDKGFFQLHMDAHGQPDECRYFARIDEVHPADADEWAFWLAEEDGMIGWTEFQTKDGKTYARAWSPSGARIQPQAFTETLTDVNGSRTVQKSMMLYRGPSGAAAPGPQEEYILVTAVEAGSQAWVEICAGIDVNPAALSLT